jgi:hypothetical protein
MRIYLLVLFAVLGVVCLWPTRAQAQLTATQLYSDAVQSLKTGDVDDAKHKLELALEVDKSFQPASALLRRISLMQSQAQSGGTGAATVPRHTLETLSFPVEFKNTTLQTALEYIRQQVEQVSGGKAQVNFVLQLPPELANKKVTLELNHVPVMEVLHYLGDLAGVTFDVQKYAIAVTPAASAPAATPH